MIKTRISAGDLKHFGLIKKALSYNITGQATEWQTEFSLYFGIDNEAVTEADQTNNSGNKKTLSLFTRYDDRLQNAQVIFANGASYTISQLDNVELANRRLNFTATPL